MTVAVPAVGVYVPDGHDAATGTQSTVCVVQSELAFVPAAAAHPRSAGPAGLRPTVFPACWIVEYATSSAASAYPRALLSVLLFCALCWFDVTYDTVPKTSRDSATVKASASSSATPSSRRRRAIMAKRGRPTARTSSSSGPSCARRECP